MARGAARRRLIARSMPHSLAWAVLAALLGATAGCDVGDAQRRPPPPGIDVHNWALQLPVQRPPEQNLTSPLTVRQPKLATFQDKDFYFVRGDALVLRVRAGGYKSRNSWYPRTELREMANNGRDEGYWSMQDPKRFHVLRTQGTVNKFTKVKPEVVILQIHTDLVRDPCSVPLIIKMQGDQANPSKTNNKVVANFEGKRLGRLSNNYTLGMPYSLRVSAGKGLINIYFQHNGKGSLTTPMLSLKTKCTAKAYFKSGCYIQSNVTMGERPSEYAETSYTLFKRYDSATP